MDYLASSTSTYKYDLQGRLLSENRVSRYDDGTTSTMSFTFLYEGSEIVGVIFTDYAGTGTYYYDKNPLGDVIGILDNSGNTVVEYKYDAYGNSIGGAASNTNLKRYNPIRYRSYYFDEDTGLYYLNARYYNPKWRRFISPDDTAYLDIENANGLNLYAYCGNDPINKYDPTGHFGIGLTLLIASGVGVAFGFGIEAAKQAYNGGDWNWDLSSWNWWEIGKASLIGAATGFAYGLGGVAGGIVKGSLQALTIAGKALTVSQSVGLLLGTAVVTNFVAGFAGYAMHTAGSKTESFNVLKGFSEGIGQTGKGVLSFYTAGMYVATGLWQVNKKSSFYSVIARATGRIVANYLPNYMFENLF